MPRYDYECGKCGHSFEHVEGWGAKSSRRCPQCRGTARRMPAAPAIVFRGRGFYSTDNRPAAPSDGQSKSSSAAADGGAAAADSGAAAADGSSAAADGGAAAADSGDSGTASAPASDSSAAKPAPRTDS